MRAAVLGMLLLLALVATANTHNFVMIVTGTCTWVQAQYTCHGKAGTQQITTHIDPIMGPVTNYNSQIGSYATFDMRGMELGSSTANISFGTHLNRPHSIQLVSGSDLDMRFPDNTGASAYSFVINGGNGVYANAEGYVTVSLYLGNDTQSFRAGIVGLAYLSS